MIEQQTITAAQLEAACRAAAHSEFDSNWRSYERSVGAALRTLGIQVNQDASGAAMDATFKALGGES